jgi:hypothetical protein
MNCHLQPCFARVLVHEASVVVLPNSTFFQQAHLWPFWIILVNSTQIRWFSRWSGGEGWTGRAISQRRLRVSKLELKGLSDYHSNETAVQAARQETSGPNKRTTLMTRLLKKGELEKSSKHDWKGQKAAHHIKRTMDKKGRIAYSNSNWRCRWKKMKTMMMLISENQSSQSQVHGIHLLNAKRLNALGPIWC